MLRVASRVPPMCARVVRFAENAHERGILRDYVAALRAYARYAKGKASIRLIEAADVIEWQADRERTLAKTSNATERTAPEELNRAGHAVQVISSSFAGSAPERP